MHSANARAIPSVSQRFERTGHFVSHYLEMVVMMLLGMLVLSGPLRALLLSGHEDPLMHAPVPAYTVAALSMLVPMVAWMRYRGHPWRQIAEMNVAMIVAVAASLAIVQLTATARLPWPTQSSLPSLTHLGLFSMAALMLYRCKDYCHTPSGGNYCAAVFTTLFRVTRARGPRNQHDDDREPGVLGTLMCWGLVLVLVVWGTISAGAYH